MRYYMHIHTGSIDSYEGWIDESIEGCTQEGIDACIERGDLVEVNAQGECCEE